MSLGLKVEWTHETLTKYSARVAGNWTKGKELLLQNRLPTLLIRR